MAKKKAEVQRDVDFIVYEFRGYEERDRRLLSQWAGDRATEIEFIVKSLDKEATGAVRPFVGWFRRLRAKVKQAELAADGILSLLADRPRVATAPQQQLTPAKSKKRTSKRSRKKL